MFMHVYGFVFACVYKKLGHLYRVPDVYVCVCVYVHTHII
jgi:hypothetical protein